MAKREVVEHVQSLLDGIHDLEMRELCIAALRQWRPKHRTENQFAVHDALARHLLALLANRPHVSIFPDLNSAKEVFIEEWQQPWMSSVVEFLLWFTRAGLAVPFGSVGSAVTYRLTRAGERFLDSSDLDHPLLPGFVHRMQVRCLDLPDGVMSLLADAQRCLDHGLMRPAVVIMGVAFEVVTEEIVTGMVTDLTLPAPASEWRAASRIAGIRKLLQDGVRFQGNSPEAKEKRGAATQALDYADELRRRRNDAAHTTPTYGFEDRQEVEELLVSAGRHMPHLWAVR